MKRVLLSAAIAAALASAGVAIAQEKPQQPKSMAPVAVQSQTAATSLNGSIVSVDNAGRSFVVKDDTTGKNVTVYWDSSTKVTGDIKTGSNVSLQTTEQSGRMMATSIDVKAAAKKPY